MRQNQSQEQEIWLTVFLFPFGSFSPLTRTLLFAPLREINPACDITGPFRGCETRLNPPAERQRERGPEDRLHRYIYCRWFSQSRCLLCIKPCAVSTAEWWLSETQHHKDCLNSSFCCWLFDYAIDSPHAVLDSLVWEKEPTQSTNCPMCSIYTDSPSVCP